jgi:hypothetical protein
MNDMLKPYGGEKKGRPGWLRLLIFCFLFSIFILTPARAEKFGDLTVTPLALVNGDTHHGYRELRILLENQSPKDAHQITLIFPQQSYPNGNSISRLSRTVAIGPGARAAVPFWQPPLPLNGNGALRILIDGDEAGSLSSPSFGRHLSRGPRYGGMTLPTTFLVSRSLNYDEVNNAFNANGLGSAAIFKAQMATGVPNAGSRSGGMNPMAWTPDTGNSGPHWIELDYNPSIKADHLRIYSPMLLNGGQIILKNAAGSNLVQLPFPGPTPGKPSGSRALREMTFPATTEPVFTVRLEFGSYSGGSISIDAVELAGPSGSAWASSAHASSEASPSSYAPSSGVGGPTERSMLRSETPVSEWSEYWLSFSPYDGIFLPASDLSAISPATLNALWRYAEAGGSLIFFGNVEVPEPWRGVPKTSLADGESFKVGFGSCFVLKNNAAKLQPLTLKAVLDDANNTARFWQSLPDENGASASFPVIENTKIPIRSTVFIMLLFVILIGPVNLIVLSRMNRRTWLLWTVPAISFVTCVIVFAYSLVREGVTPDMRLDGMTLLDEANRRATTIGITAFYCPLTPSQGLFFSSETEATPLLEQSWNYFRRGGTAHEVDWTQSQHLSRGWISARVPAYFLLRKSETRRERLQFESANGQLSVVNGLGAPIHSVWFANSAGQIFTATNIAAGQRAALVSSTNSIHTDHLGPQSLFEKAGYITRPDFAGDAANYLLPNTYIAELNGNPFLENGLGAKSSARTKTHAVVYGLVEPSKP